MTEKTTWPTFVAVAWSCGTCRDGRQPDRRASNPEACRRIRVRLLTVRPQLIVARRLVTLEQLHVGEETRADQLAVANLYAPPHTGCAADCIIRRRQADELFAHSIA